MEPKNSDDFNLLKKSTRTLIESCSNTLNFKNVLFSNLVNESSWLRCEIDYDNQYGPYLEILD